MSDDLLTAKTFEDQLNRHGLSFQYAVLMRIQQHSWVQSADWIPWAHELPVELESGHTRLDFLLEYRYETMHIVAECKRVNPSLADWCFVRSPFAPESSYEDHAYFEYSKRNEQLSPSKGVIGRKLGGPVYSIGLEIKNCNKGDAQEYKGQSRGAIEDACSQVLRGLNGWIQFLSKHHTIVKHLKRILFIPVIFTTARLWVSSIDLAKTDLETGNIQVPQESIEERPWVVFHYHQSPSLKHSMPLTNLANDKLAEIIINEYVRSVIIVSSKNIDEFLTWQGWRHLAAS